MSEIKLVLGRAHSGKSAYVYDRYVEDTKDISCDSYVFLVPDQMTLAVQKELIKRKKAKNTLYKTSCFGFTRMAYKLFEENGSAMPTVIDEIGKLLLIQKAVQNLDKENKLSIFKGNSKRSGFIHSVATFLKEMTEYGITDDAAIDIIARMPEKKILNEKITDILAIRKAYEDLKGASRIAAEDILIKALGLIKESKLFNGANVVVDGFSTLTPVQLSVLAEIILVAKSVTFVLDMDVANVNGKTVINDCSLDSVFYEPQKVYNKIRNLADKLGIDNISETACFESHYGDKSSLSHLEKHYEQKFEKYKGEPEEIELTSAYDISEEIDDVLSKITMLTSKGDYHYRDIAIIATNQDAYAEIIDEKFARVGIPYFTDHKKSMFHNIVVEGILSAVAVCSQEFNYESVVRYLRCGLFDSYENIDKLDLYVRATGVRGINAYKKPFTGRKIIPKRFDINSVEELDAFKDNALKTVIKLYNTLKNGSIAEKISGILSWLEETKVFDILDRKTEELQQNGQTSLAMQYAQTKDMVLRILNQIGEILGEENSDNAELYKLLELGFEALKVGVIPAAFDAVTIGDMKRSRLSDVKVLFIIGMNDKVFPAAVSDIGILSDSDREALKNKSDLELADTAKLQTIAMKYFVYRSLAKPSEKLYLSYTRTGEDQKTVYPSYVCGQIKKLFPDIKEKTCTKKIYHPRQGLLALADPQSFDFEQGTVAALEEFYSDKESYRNDFDKINSAKKIYDKVAEVIDKSYALALFADGHDGKPVISTSKLERFATCPLRHFLDYGMELMPRQEYEVRPLDIGNIYHDVLDKLITELGNKNISYKELHDDTKLTDVLSELLKKTAAELKFDFEAAGAKNEYISKQMLNVLKKNVRVILYQIENSGMEPIKSECSFGMKVHDVHTYNAYDIEGSPFKIKGKIDRVDAYADSDKNIYRIIDYKSGSTKYNETKVAEGINLQLFVYLSAIVNSEQKRYAKEVIPAGAYYYPIDESIPELTAADISGCSDKDISDMLWKQYLKDHRLDGISQDSDECLKALDTAFANRADGVNSELIASLRTKKGGDAYANYRMYKKDVYDRILAYTENKVIELGEGILSGNVNAMPYEENQTNSCKYCPYKDKCGFESGINGSFRRLSAKLPIENPENTNKVQEEADGI